MGEPPSPALVAEALEQIGGGEVELHILTRLGTFHPLEQLVARPYSLEQLTTGTGFTRRAVLAALQLLIDGQFIVDDRSNGDERTRRYRLLLP